MSDQTTIIVTIDGALTERQADALRRAFTEGHIKVPTLVASASIEKVGSSDAVVLRFEPEEIRVVIDPSE